MSDKKEYTVESPILYKKKRYEVGDQVTMDLDIGEPLLGDGTLAEVSQDSDGPGRDDLLQLAIQSLDPENNDHFTNSGKPQATALAEIIKTPVSAAERDAAWEQFQAGKK